MPTDSQKVARSASSFPPSFLQANYGDLGLFPGEQYILLIGLVKGKRFFPFVVSNRCSDVQKLFSVKRDGSNNVTYKITVFIYSFCSFAPHYFYLYFAHSSTANQPFQCFTCYIVFTSPRDLFLPLPPLSHLICSHCL